ncbi:hypothetical protein [Pseudooceanicola sp.]|uniref:hypothetical protein n=1 Tax=Pseudooceanicola TaxID=1679449 RepID=UPI0035119734
MNPELRKFKVAEICDTVGRKVVAHRMNVGAAAVSNAVSDGIFPARWYREMNNLCREHGLLCSDELFNFVVAPSEKETSSQGAA